MDAAERHHFKETLKVLSTEEKSNILALKVAYRGYQVSSDSPNSD